MKRISQYFLKNQFVYVPLILGILLFAIYFLDVYFIPDLIGISRLKEPWEVVSIAISILSSVMGISLALILIGFEIVRNRFGSIGVKRFLNNPLVSFQVSLQISIVCFGFYFLLIRGIRIDSFELTFIYILSFLFILSMMLLWPVSKKMLFESDSIYKTIKLECEKIDGKSISEILGYNRGKLDYISDIESIDSSPFLILRDLGIKYAQDKNQHIPGLIIQQTTKNFIPIIGIEDIDRRALREGFGTLFIVWNGILSEASRNQLYLPLKQFWDSIEEIHLHYCDNGIPLIKLEALDEFYSDFINISLEHNNDEVIIDGLFQIEKIFKNHIDKCVPDENSISLINQVFKLPKNERHNPWTQLQWDHATSFAPNMLKIVIERSIKYRKDRVFGSAISVYEYLIYVARSSNMGKYQKHIVVVDLVSGILYFLKEAVYNDTIERFHTTRFLGSTIFSDIIKENPSYLKHLTFEIINYIKFLSEKNIFDTRYSELNDFAGKLRLLASIHFKNDEYCEIIDLYLELLEWLKNKYEREVELNAQNYIGLHQIVISMKKWHSYENKFENGNFKKKDKKLISEDFVKRLNTMIENFTRLNEAEIIVKNGYFA